MVSVKLFDQRSYPFKLVFNNSRGEVIGELIEGENGELSFKGDSDECSEILFEKIIKLNSRFIRNNNLKQKAA